MGIFLTGSSLAAASIKAPRIISKNLISVIFCESVGKYGVIMGIIMTGKIDVNHDLYKNYDYYFGLVSLYLLVDFMLIKNFILWCLCRSYWF